MTRPLVLYHVSDIHFGAEDRAAHDWFAAEVARERPDAVICTGDVTMRGTRREFDAAAQWLGGLAAPVRVEPGNHDMPYYHHMLARLTRTFERFDAMQRAVEVVIDLPGVALVPLRTVTAAQWRLNWSKGRIAPAALDHALARLAAAEGHAVRIALCHHPLVEADTEGTASTRGGKQALAALARGGAQIVLSGHVHDPFDITLRPDGLPIRMIGAGTLSQRLRSTPPSYNRLTIAGGQVTVDLRLAKE
ncbi:MAG: metallophosphoesterase [Sphingomonadales bacterium]|nr:metallophosphoesterase [Sphingomonadales bacterium]